jgi:lycopene elongase/hydratase (dihydrobisanhydrobacterioruberin-forming)
MRTILKLSRPRFWIYLVGPFLIGLAFAQDHFSTISFIALYAFFYFSFPANAFLYGLNDLFDKKTDNYNPKKIIHEAKISKKNLKLYKITVILGVILALPIILLSSLPAKIFLYLFLILGFFYSAPPLRFKSKPLLDFLSNILYAMPGFFGYAIFTNSISELAVFLASLFWTSAMHLFSAIPDITYDKNAEIQTTAVILGRKWSLILCATFWAISVFFVISYSNLFLLGLIYPLLPLLILFKNFDESRIYWYFPFINTIFGFAIFIYAAIS